MPLFPILEKSERREAKDVDNTSTSSNSTRDAATREWLKIGQSYRQGGQSKDNDVSAGAVSHPPTRSLLSQPIHKQDIYKSNEQSEIMERMESQDIADDVCGTVDRRRLRDSSSEQDGDRTSGFLLTGMKTDSWSDGSPQHGKKGRKRSKKDSNSRHQRDKSSSSGKSKKRRHERETPRRRKCRSTSDSSGSEGAPHGITSDHVQSLRERPTVCGSSGRGSFFIDRHGDSDNLSLEGFYRMDVPVHHEGHEKTRKKHQRSMEAKDSRYFGLQARKLNDGVCIPRLQLAKGDKRKDHALLWASVGASLDEGRRGPGASAEGQRGGHQVLRLAPDFLPIDPYVEDEDGHQRTHSYALGGEAEGLHPMETLEECITRRTKEFNQLTRERPDSVELWLQYADFQQHAVRALHGGADGHLNSATHVSMTMEKKAAILEGALRYNPSSVKLRLAQLRLASQMKEHAAVDTLWKKAIESCRQLRPIWPCYLQFKAGHFASFSLSNQRDTCARALSSLRLRMEEMKETYSDEGRYILKENEEADIEPSMLDVLWNHCIMERAAGYEERAIGVLQGMMELNMLGHGEKVPMNLVERFWDSEAPRIGDAHPSEAGLSLWLEASSPGASSFGVSQASQEVVRAPRRPHGARPSRKRAVDFFSPDLHGANNPVISVQQPREKEGLDSDEVSPIGNANTGLRGARWRGNKISGVNAFQVLEEAYHTATALGSFLSAERDVKPAEEGEHVDAEKPSPGTAILGMKNLAGGRSDQAHDRRGSLPSKNDLLGHRDNTISMLKRQMGAVKTESGSGSSSPVVVSSAVAEVAAEAVDAEGLIWVDESRRTAYSVRHGYRIDVQDAQDSVSGSEYGRILRQMRGGDTEQDSAEQNVEASSFAASRRLRNRVETAREAELLKESAILGDVPADDTFSTWAKAEVHMEEVQWQPVRCPLQLFWHASAAHFPEEAEERPDRVVFVEDLKPILFHLSLPAFSGVLIEMVLTMAGLEFPRSHCTHSSRVMSRAGAAGSFEDGGSQVSLLTSLGTGLQAVWTASGGGLVTSGSSVQCDGYRNRNLSPHEVSIAADQFLLLSEKVRHDSSRQIFLRNVLHHLIRAPESLKSGVEPASSSSSTQGAWTSEQDSAVQLQCTLMMFEGLLASRSSPQNSSIRQGEELDPRATGMSARGGGRSSLLSGNDSHEARKVAKSLLEASEASATDLRLWTSYVQFLNILDSREESMKVAEKALSMVQVINAMDLKRTPFGTNSKQVCNFLLVRSVRLTGGDGGLCLAVVSLFEKQALPEEKKPFSAELFWITFRLHAGLPLGPHDAPPLNKNGRLANLFRDSPDEAEGNRQMALLVLCSFAEGTFQRPKKNSKRQGRSHGNEGVKAPRLLTARRLMANHVSRIAGELSRGTITVSQPGNALDKTSSLMYYSAAWAWLEYLTRGAEAAGEAMQSSLELTNALTKEMESSGDSTGSNTGADTSKYLGHGRYSWKVFPECDPLGVCLERMHRAYCELFFLAQHFSPATTGPRRVRSALLQGLLSFPCDPGMLSMFLDTEKFSGSQLRLVHHLSEVLRCISETCMTVPMQGQQRSPNAHGTGTSQSQERALQVKNWSEGSFARLRRCMEAAVTHPTGRIFPLLWRMYISLEILRGHYTRAKHLFWRAVHACPGHKTVWMDAFHGANPSAEGVKGLRPTFKTKELADIVETMLDKALHLRGEPP